MCIIDNFEIFVFDCPLGRMIGDNSCYYNQMIILAIRIDTNEGHTGWGYTEVMTNGTFLRKAWWVRSLPEIPVLNEVFRQSWWKAIYKKNPLELEMARKTMKSSEIGIDKAVRLALWDLLGQCQNLPLYKILGGHSVSNRVKAYGSPLDFHLNDEQTVALVNKFLKKGFKTIKIKIGAEDYQRDVERLLLIKETAGDKIDLTADANEAWTWEVALKRLEQFESAGVKLKYLEDPIYRTDIDGFCELTKRSSIPIIGNDYIDNINDLEHMIKEGGIKGIRTHKDFDYMIACKDLSKKYDIPVYIGNSQFEVSVHAAVAFGEVAMMEFADLGWNELVEHPVQFEDGFAIAPEAPGHGLYPKKELLSK